MLMVFKIYLQKPLRCQSAPPWTGTIRMRKTPVPAMPVASQRPMTPHIHLPRSLDSNTSLSTLSAPLFTEDRHSSISEDDMEICNAEITLINRQNKLNKISMTHSTGGRPTSTPSTNSKSNEDIGRTKLVKMDIDTGDHIHYI